MELDKCWKLVILKCRQVSIPVDMQVLEVGEVVVAETVELPEVESQLVEGGVVELYC